VLLALPSCANGRKPVYPVTGQVFCDKKPAAGATVVFHPVGAKAEEALRPAGQVDADGVFRLTTYNQNDGAPDGEYLITVEWRPKKKTPFEADPPDRLQGRYSNPQTSGLRARVERGNNEVQAFHLKETR
jgi:hypothetical protein